MDYPNLKHLLKISFSILGILLAPHVILADPVEYDLELRATIHTNTDYLEAGNIFTADANCNGWYEVYRYADIDGYGDAMTIEEVSPGFQVTELYRRLDALPWEVGDADSDGLPDLIISTYYSTFDLLEVTAPGGLPTTTVFSAGWYGTYESHASTMDLDQDGFKEVVTSGNGYDDLLHVFECNGDNSFEYLGFLPSINGTLGHLALDLDRDGQTELIVGDWLGFITVFEHHGGILPEMTWQQRVNPNGWYCAGALVVDLEMDGTNEVAFSCYDVATRRDVVRILDSLGDDDYIVIDVGDLGASLPSLEAGHATGHLWPELVQYIRYDHDLALWSYSGQGEYWQSGRAIVPGVFGDWDARGYALADFDFDGRDEIVWATERGYDLPGAIFSVDYSDDFEPPVTSGFDPPVGSGLPPGSTFDLTGTAEDDFSGIRSVEASMDLGVSWEIISIFPDWSIEMQVPMEGEFEVALRATDCTFKVEDPPAVWWGHAATPTPTPTPTLTPTITPTPTPLRLGVQLVLPSPYFSTGETFQLDALLGNPGSGFDTPLAVVLDVQGAYWFWPSWVEYPPDWEARFVRMRPGAYSIPIIDPFPWPDTGAETLTGIWFHAALLDETMTAILGESDSVEWGYGP